MFVFYICEVVGFGALIGKKTICIQVGALIEVNVCFNSSVPASLLHASLMRVL